LYNNSTTQEPIVNLSTTSFPSKISNTTMTVTSVTVN
jgi:hypothetical protein